MMQVADAGTPFLLLAATVTVQPSCARREFLLDGGSRVARATLQWEFRSKCTYPLSWERKRMICCRLLIIIEKHPAVTSMNAGCVSVVVNPR